MFFLPVGQSETYSCWELTHIGQCASWLWYFWIHDIEHVDGKL